MKSKLRTTCALLAAAAVAGLTAGCATSPASSSSTQASADNTAVYAGKLQPMNTSVTGDKTTGKVKLVVDGDQLTAHVIVHGAPANMVHWQHFHGFKDGSKATCPTPVSDMNGDGVVDLIETHPTSGKTMVPFIKDPTSMDVAHGTYPKADANGDYHYQETMSLSKLQSVFHKEFGADLDLDKRVVFIHGVPADTDLPSTVASLGPIPAQVTLPIACAQLNRVK